MKYTPLIFKLSAANCPHCGAFSAMKWSELAVYFGKGSYGIIDKFHTSKCSHCDKYSFWEPIIDTNTGMPLNYKMYYPIKGNVPLPNPDMPDDVKTDYIEASSILQLSPRGSAALLRLAVQKLCIFLGEKGRNINEDIKSLVSKGLNPLMQKALDSVRVIGNNAVHPGQIDLKDDFETATKLFGFINVIVDVMITQPKNINEFYELKIPDKTKQEIDKRDFKQK